MAAAGIHVSSLQLYVAGHDVAALRETLSSELSKINDPRIEAHPGMNCIQIGLPGKLILSKRKGLRVANSIG